MKASRAGEWPDGRADVDETLVAFVLALGLALWLCRSCGPTLSTPIFEAQSTGTAHPRGRRPRHRPRRLVGALPYSLVVLWSDEPDRRSGARSPRRRWPPWARAVRAPRRRRGLDERRGCAAHVGARSARR
jgi:hypothetical protein